MFSPSQFSQLPWASSYLEDKRFQRLAVVLLVLSLVFGVIVPLITVPKLEPPTAEEIKKIAIKWKKPELTEEQKRRLAELQRKKEEELARLEAERKKREEEERKRREEEAKKREEERKKAEAERLKQLEEQRRKQAELDKERQKRLEEERRKQAERDKERQKQLAEQRKKEAEQAAIRAEQERIRQAEEAKRRAAEEARRRAEAEKAKARQLALSTFADIAPATDTKATAVTQSGSLTSSKTAATQGTPMASASKQLISSNTVGKGSGGVNTSALSDAGVGGGGSILEGRATTQVASVDLGIADGAGDGGGGSGSSSNARTRSELSAILDRYKARMAQQYNRALRKNPTLGGKMVVKITIAPSGDVTDVKLEGSDIDDQDLISKILTLIKGINFGAKDVATTVVNYPIDFNA